MEKVFHVGRLSPKQNREDEIVAPVQLKRGHLWLSSSVAAEAFGSDRQVYAVYYPTKKSLLLAPHANEHFGKLHKCSLLMLKDRSLLGDKSLSLQEIIIDHDLNNRDRVLTYSGGPDLPLNVQLD